MHYTLKVDEKGFKMASMMNKLALINSYEIILEKQNIFFAKNHCEIQVRTILVCTLYSIKYGTSLPNFRLEIALDCFSVAHVNAPQIFGAENVFQQNFYFFVSLLKSLQTFLPGLTHKHL